MPKVCKIQIQNVPHLETLPEVREAGEVRYRTALLAAFGGDVAAAESAQAAAVSAGRRMDGVAAPRSPEDLAAVKLWNDARRAAWLALTENGTNSDFQLHGVRPEYPGTKVDVSFVEVPDSLDEKSPHGAG